mmetsp:Transcript_68866/g.183426  ORF Transcript_68866/g.183426 Transcript_68866/m.183426 type:complete len:293 (-) Transcript_68866:107-985(-)
MFPASDTGGRAACVPVDGQDCDAWGEVASSFEAWTAVVAWLNLFHFLRGTYWWGWLIVLFEQVIKDVWPFLVLMFVYLVLVTHAYLLGPLHGEPGSQRYIQSFVQLYRLTIMGEIIEGTTDHFQGQWLILFLGATLLGTIVALNFLIAFVSNTFERTMQQRRPVMYLERARLVREVEEVVLQLTVWFPCLRSRLPWLTHPPRFLVIVTRGDDDDDHEQTIRDIHTDVKDLSAALETQQQQLDGLQAQVRQVSEGMKTQLAGLDARFDRLERLLGGSPRHQPDSAQSTFHTEF